VTEKRLGARPLRRSKCITCATAPAAMAQVDYCFACWPGGPVVPPPCLRCGSRKNYFTSGICRRCHRDGNPGVESCRDCHAWGVGRLHDWLCAGCRSWRREHTRIAACRVCSSVLTLGQGGVCRLCRKQGTLMRGDKELLDLLGANAHGQQLFFADMFYVSARQRATRPNLAPTAAARETLPRRKQRAVQLRLFDARRDLAAHGRENLIERCDPIIAARVDREVAEHAMRHGWTRKAMAETRSGIRIVIGLQDDLNALIKATDVTLLRGIELPVRRILDVLAEMELLDDDRTPAVETWFAQRTAELPEPMRDELGIWFLVMRDGSTTSPRRKPRAESTINVQLNFALPALRAWATAGMTSLREVSRDDVLMVLPAEGNARAGCGQGLKSIFSVLKGRKTIFVNPIGRVVTGQYQEREPVPQDPAVLREALQSSDPARAAIVALIAYHGLPIGAVRRLQLTDIHDRLLHQDEREIPLASPVHSRITAYLDERAVTWPATANPHLFVNSRSAWRDTAVGHRWVHLKIGPNLTATAIRADRLLHEAHATHGDTRRLTDLFGLSIKAASRYTNTVDHPGFGDLDPEPADS
jgi:hypothetical protein